MVAISFARFPPEFMSDLTRFPPEFVMGSARFPPEFVMDGAHFPPEFCAAKIRNLIENAKKKRRF